jgi:dTDP-4-amino-4,6-dideoxygalactose transaminase
MGLCNLKYINGIIAKRKKKVELYDRLLNGRFQRPTHNKDTQYNNAYYPVVFDSEKQLLKIITRLNKENIFPRRYFYPSLNTLPYVDNTQKCPIAEDISKRIACLPLYIDLEDEIINKICKIVNQ